MAKHLFNSRRSRFLAPKKFFIVATEGEQTEKIYLDEFKPPRGAMIQLTVIENKQHKTKPIACLERLKRYATKNFLGPEDELWLMIDRDSWSEAELDEVATEIAKNPQFHLALSNPCFELWLYLHLADNKPFDHRDKLPPALAKILGRYDKAGYDVERIVKGVDEAIRRAERLDTPPQNTWPKNQQTHVYRLMKKILGR